MRAELFDYYLPPELIAQTPKARRTASRLLLVPGHANANDGNEFSEIPFAQIGDLLAPGDLLVVNDTRVLPARIKAHKSKVHKSQIGGHGARKSGGGAVEIMLERVLDPNRALVQLRANKPIRIGQTLCLATKPDSANPAPPELRVTERDNGFFIIQTCATPSSEKSDNPTADLPTLFQQHGEIPLPPYIRRTPTATDHRRYQTVYARTPGAVAAPTAGLHFDRALVTALRRAGVDWARITLHVGAGTFQPLRTQDIKAHQMHREWLSVNRETCTRINRAKAHGHRIIAVGTTVVRALETAAQIANSTVANPTASPNKTQTNPIAPYCGDTQLFITPGFPFRITDALITNFHLPRSTLLMLVSAFAGREKILRAYHHAIAQKFRFYSYGDAMFLERAK